MPRTPSLFDGLTMFAGVPARTLARHGLRPALRPFRRGESIVLAGEPRARVWFLRSGWAQVRASSPAGRESTAAIAVPGDLLGCATDLHMAVYPCSVVALTNVLAVSVPAPAFGRWLSSDAAAACRMIDVLAQRLREIAQTQTINAERSDVRLRLTLGWLARKFGLKIPATRALLSDITGLRPETCSRVLSVLRRQGVLRVSPRLIEILRPERLSA